MDVLLINIESFLQIVKSKNTVQLFRTSYEIACIL